MRRGEFVTTGFVGERGAKGYVVSLADLQDLQVELDINQNDFARLGPQQRASVTTDAYPDRKYAGYIVEMSPEANRQKATVQVKVQILQARCVPATRDERQRGLRCRERRQRQLSSPPGQRSLFQRAQYAMVRCLCSSTDAQCDAPSKTGPSSGSGVRVDEGLHGGEDLIVNPPASCKTAAGCARKEPHEPRSRHQARDIWARSMCVRPRVSWP